MATMDEMDLKDRLADIYYQFMIDMHIGKGTGIVNYDNEKSKNWRFATMPFIGRKYNNAELKILFIGLDMGKDINKKGNTYLSFGERHNSISKLSQLQKCNPHIAGTYVASLALLSQYNDKWKPEWKALSQNHKRTMATLVHKYHKEKAKRNERVEEKDNVLEYIGITNLFKFVTVDRDKAQGDNNRRWIDKETELNLLKAEIGAFNPDVIILQGSGRYLHKGKNEGEEIFNFFKYCKGNGIVVIKGKHPSYPKDGWNKIQGVNNLLDMYKEGIEKIEGNTLNSKS